MLHRLSEIARSTVTVEGEELPVTDLWLDADEGRLRYLGVDVGGWLSHRVALVSVERLSWDDGWAANLTREEVEGATFQSEGGFHLDMRDLPAILTGPFGNTISPLLISAGLKVSAERTLPDVPEDRTTVDTMPDPTSPRVLTRTLQRPEDWMGRAVFVRDGEVGEVQGLLIDDTDWSLAALLVGHVARPPAAVPWDAVRHVAAPGAHLVLAADAHMLESAPAVPGPEVETTAWRSDLAAHYGVHAHG